MRTMENARGVVPPGLIIAFLLLAWCPSAFALNPALDVNQYAHTSWQMRDGFPKGQITSIAQTPDGYLWLGTEFGLIRFDGIKNVVWTPPANQQLPSNFIFSLLVARDGTLWIGTVKGLVSWKGGKLTQYAELAGRYIFTLLEDREGSVWASGLTVTSGRLCAIRNGSVQCSGEGSLGRGVFNLYEDSKGNLWAGVKDGLWRWKPGPPKFYSLAGEPDGIQCFGEDNDGTLLVGWNGGIHRFTDGKTVPYLIPGRTGPIRAQRLLRDRDGGLWIGTFNEGLAHIHDGRTDVFGLSDGLSGGSGNRLLEDREGNIWVATGSGLDRFRDFAVATFSATQGLSSSRIQSVLADKAGGIWLATGNDLNRWNSGQLSVLNVSSNQSNSFKPNSLFQDDTGRIWVSTPFGFGYLDNDRFISVSTVPGAVVAMAQDTTGNLWISNEHAGLFQVRGGSVVQQIAWSNFGRNDHVSAIAPDAEHGGVWLGFFLGGIVYYSDGQIRASYGVADGLTQGRVSDLQVDKDGALWVATEGGLTRVKNGRVTALNSQNGLPCNAVHWVREDDAGSFWLYTACGLVRIARAELADWSAAMDQGIDRKPAIHATVFDGSDGVKIVASGNHFFPQVAK